MPSATAYRRAPLVDPAYVPLTDAAVHAGGLLAKLTDRVLKMVNVENMSVLDAALATKLGGYTQTPPMPDVAQAAMKLREQPAAFVEACRAGVMIASMNRDRAAMLEVLKAMLSFGREMPMLSEEQLFSVGADALRLTVDLYRRTGQSFLLDVLENLRARLPDVSGLMHVFPFQNEYQAGDSARTPQEQEYYDRMQRFATGKLTADALAMSALLSQYSGSGRDAAAPKAGLNAFMRYHGMPSGAFAADPYLAGRDPARAVELPAACAQAEAYLDALLTTGDSAMADRLESMLENVLADLVEENGVRTLSPTNRLADDDSCTVLEPSREDVSSLLRALYAVRRSIWLSRDDETIAYILPVSGGCVTRMGDVPVRLSAEVNGVFQKTVTLRVECRQSVAFALHLRVPGYADGAQVSLNGGKSQPVPQGDVFQVRRTWNNGDVITLVMNVSPRLETGWRGSASIYVGAKLMALSLPDEQAGWRYAVMRSLPMTSVEDEGVPYALLTACEAPQWREKGGFILPPPQGVPAGPAYELTLIPFAGTFGRIAAFPCVMER